MSNPPTFNLLSERWIPVIWDNDASEPRASKVGIREALNRSHEIRCISHTSPFVEFGLYRLLITIVLDAYIMAGKRPTVGKMKQMLALGFDNCLNAYLDKHRNGFDLWNDDNRFLQPKPINDAKAGPIAVLFPAIPSGANVIHWHHFLEDENEASAVGAATTRISEEEAARWLTTVSPFTFKGKAGAARTLAGDPPIYVLALGMTLFETLVLNLPRPSGRVTYKQELERGPAWRTKPDFEKTKLPTLTEGFTWPVRYISLERGNDAITKSVYTVAFKKTKKTKINAPVYDVKYGWRDPNAGTETTNDKIDHITAKPDIPIWRDLVHLFLVAGEGEALRADKRRSRPEVISNALRILDTPRFRVAVYGMRKKRGGGDGKIEEWFRSVLTFPTEVARDNRLSGLAIHAFNTTQNVADDLRTALRMLRGPFEAKKTAGKTMHQTEIDCLNHYWQRLELPLGIRYLDALGSDLSVAKQELWSIIRREAMAAFTRATGPHRRTADGLFRIANATNWFEWRLNINLPKPGKEKKV